MSQMEHTQHQLAGGRNCPEEDEEMVKRQQEQANNKRDGCAFSSLAACSMLKRWQEEEEDPYWQHPPPKKCASNKKPDQSTDSDKEGEQHSNGGDCLALCLEWMVELARDGMMVTRYEETNKVVGVKKFHQAALKGWDCYFDILQDMPSLRSAILMSMLRSIWEFSSNGKRIAIDSWFVRGILRRTVNLWIGISYEKQRL
ncbi:hypothetical protein B0H19DRAFT_1085006 [Mycena capillaripes]|nr:hypothetical protein B0H19DRAFT_1085006 [Mycena capillaripes]